MRRITNPEEAEKKENRNKIIVGLVLVALMVLSTAGYAVYSGIPSSKQNTYDFNGQRFEMTESGYWKTSIEGFDFYFQNLPNDTLDIPVPSIDLKTFSGKTLYFASENNIASQEIFRNLNPFVLRAQESCYQNKTCTDNLPVKNCTDNLIIIEESNSTLIEKKENCIFIKGNYSDLVRISDAFVYKVIGLRSI